MFDLYWVKCDQPRGQPPAASADFEQRYRAEMNYWRTRLDDIIHDWFKTLLGVSGAGVAVLALAGAYSLYIALTAVAIGLPLLLTYFNIVSAIGWEARRNLWALQKSCPIPSTVWPESEVRSYKRRVPGAWPAMATIVGLSVPVFVVACVKLPYTWNTSNFWDNLGISIPGIPVWLGFTICGFLAVFVVWHAIAVGWREVHGAWDEPLSTTL